MNKSIIILLVISVSAGINLSMNHSRIGSGGFLNEVPQAEVLVDGKKAPDNWKVFVHPFEGSLVIDIPESDSLLAFDKDKKAIVSISKEFVKTTDWIFVIDVEEDAPWRAHANRPEFSRLSARGVTDFGQSIIISVQR